MQAGIQKAHSEHLHGEYIDGQSCVSVFRSCYHKSSVHKGHQYKASFSHFQLPILAPDISSPSAFLMGVAQDRRCFRVLGSVGISKKSYPEDSTHCPWKSGTDTSVL